MVHMKSKWRQITVDGDKYSWIAGCGKYEIRWLNVRIIYENFHGPSMTPKRIAERIKKYKESRQ